MAGLGARVVAVSAWVLLAVACAEPDIAGPMRADSAGVEIVTNPRDRHPLSWTADTLRLLGGLPAGPEGFFRVRASLVDVDSAGRIFVLDPTQSQVAAFDTTGAVLGVVGRKGQGPGELEYPLSLAVAPGGEIHVFDAGKGALVRYTMDHGHLGATPYTFDVIHNRFRHMGLGPSGAALWFRDPYSGSDDRYDRLLWVRGADTLRMVADKPAYRSTAEYPACGMRYSLAIPLSPHIYWAQSGDRVAVSSWGQYRVDMFHGGALVRSVRLGEAAAPLEESGAVAYLESQGYVGPCNSDASTVVERHGFHPYAQPVLGVAMTPAGELWVRSRGAGSTESLDIFDPSGAYIGSLPAAFPLPLTFLPDGRGIVQVSDTFDVERLGIIRIRRKVGEGGGAS